MGIATGSDKAKPGLGTGIVEALAKQQPDLGLPQTGDGGEGMGDPNVSRGRHRVLASK